MMTEITVVPAPEPLAPLVEAPVAVKPGALAAFLHSAYERVQKPIARHALKSDLSKLVSMAKDHEANGLAAGHKYYCLLHKLACQKAEAYADLRGIDKQQLYAELASLEVLRKLANPGAQSAKAGVLVVVLGVVLIPIAIGLGSGMVAMGYRWALHIFGVH
jgi:hypothetical protein